MVLNLPLGSFSETPQREVQNHNFTPHQLLAAVCWGVSLLTKLFAAACWGVLLLTKLLKFSQEEGEQTC
jgi:hypothetical protein